MRCAHATEVLIRIVRDARGVALSIVVGVPNSKVLTWMELDTGNDDPAIDVSESVAPLLGAIRAVIHANPGQESCF